MPAAGPPPATVVTAEAPTAAFVANVRHEGSYPRLGASKRLPRSADYGDAAVVAEHERLAAKLAEAEARLARPVPH